MFKATKSFRFIVVLIAIVAMSALAISANWSGTRAFGFFEPGSSATNVSPERESAPVMTIGTCDTAGLIEVESTLPSGPTAYATLAAAFTDINAGVHTGVITVEVCGDTTEPTVAAAPSAILNASGAGAASYSAISIKPVGGVSRTITGAATAGFALIDMNGADNVTFDGVNASGNSLTIANTTVSATSITSTFRFIGGATNNTITNSNIQGSGTMSVATNGATIFFSTDAVALTGNDNNTISNNNIGPAGANLPTKGILCNGSTGATTGNTGLVINNNNIFDYFGAAVTSAGVAVNGGCKDSSITNNRFYQTATRTWTTGAEHNGILLNSTTATSGAQGFTITGNIVGYASNTQTGTYTMTGSTGTFRGIRFNGITGGTVSNINTNTVASVSVTGVTSSGTTSSSPFTGILVTNGLANTNSNTVGSQSATGSLTFSTTTTSSTDVHGIYNFSLDDWTANTNDIGGIAVTNLGASGTFILYPLRANTSTAKVFNATSNNIGGTIANSLQLTSTGASSQVVGMSTANAISTWTTNTVRNLTNNNGTGTTTAASVIGMSLTSTTPNQNLSQNTIHTLTNTNATGASIVTGIQFTGSTANVVERNLIYNLLAPTTSTAAEINGIRVAGGTTTYRNNMIALGANQAISVGTTASNSGTTGINGFNGFLGTDTFVHNSIYIGGTATSGTGASFALNGTQTVNVRSFRDNIFVNARSNSGATGTNYAVKINGTTANPTGLTINNNVYFTSGTGGVFGYFNGADVANIGAWRTAVGQDAGSIFGDPAFNDATNAVPDLHIHPTNPTVAESNGVDVGVTLDFDGQTRSGLTPVDIGADAGNFNGVDLAAPIISYTPFANTNLTTNRDLLVTITDVSGVATGGNAPRIYFNKNAGTYFSTGCVLSSGTVNNGVWTCTIDNTLIGGVVTTDQIRYHVVAQDLVGNLASNPSAGFSGTNVNTVTTPPTTPSTYTIVAPIFGTKTVCASGCDYTTLTGATGIFKAINDSVATGNINIEIAGDLIVGEDGTNGLNTLAEEPVGSNFTVRIYPTGTAPRLITGTFNGALIRTVGASRVTIDGSIGGTGTSRDMTITNTSVTTPTVINLGSVGTTPFTNNTVKNCIVINGATTSSAIVIGDGTVVGNAGFFSNVTIQNNDVQKAFVGIFATGGTTPQGGSNLTYTQNKVDTSGANAIRLVGLYMQGVNGATVTNNTVGNFSAVEGENDTGIWLASGTGNTTVSGNTVSGLGMTLTTGFAPIGIRESSGLAASGNSISNNTVSGLTTTGSTGINGIAVSSGGITIQRNKVSNIQNNSTGTFGAFGINVTAGNDDVIKNNFVSDVNHNMTGGAAFGPDFGVVGIRLGAGTGHKVYNNSVNLFGPHPGTATTSLLSAAFSISTTSQTGIDVRNNIFANNITGGTTSIAHVSVFLPSGGTSAMNLTWNKNSYYFGTDVARQGVGQAGTTAGANFFTTLGALTAYTSTLGNATNDNASIASTGAVPFASGTDLHITSAAPEYNTGVTIAAVTDDVDGNTRPLVGTYDIGADEVELYTVGGNVTGLVGTGLVLQNNAGNDLAIAADGSFTFTTALAPGATYAVTVFTQPTSPSQTCNVTNGSGTIAAANVTNVTVTCVTNTYTVGGTISGLAGGTAVLQNNGGDNLAVGTNGSFTFATSVASGATYAVTVLTQPSGPSQTCNVTNGSGTVGGANVTNVSVVCTTNAYTVGGSVSGLNGTGFVLRNNGGDDLPISANGAFAFTTPVASGASYNVTVFTQPSLAAPELAQTCTVTNGTGTVGGGAVTNVSVACTTNNYTIGGTVSGLVGSGLVLQNNAGDNLPIAADGSFTFATSIASGATYAVTVLTQPSSPTQTCSVTNGSGTVGGANVTNVSVTCTTNTYTVGGTVTGLTGTGFVIQNNGGDNLPIAADGSFTFSTSVASGATYAVTVLTQPTGPIQSCAVTSGGGTVTNANITNVTITCTTPAFVEFGAQVYREDESQTAQIRLVRTGNTSITSIVNVSSSSGGGNPGTGGTCGTAGVDYGAITNQAVTFNPGDSDAFATVQICTGDTLVEIPDETASLTMSIVSGASAGTQSTATLRINDTASQFLQTIPHDPIEMFFASVANPYPSQITVAGAPNIVGTMRVTLYDVSHANPDNMDVLLVGPLGQKYLLVADTGGPLPVSPNAHVTLTFSDFAGGHVSDSGAWQTGQFLPTVCESNTVFAPGAPALPYVTPNCSTPNAIGQTMFGSGGTGFGLTNPNGVWSLYVRDDAGQLRPIGDDAANFAVGRIAGGWGLEFLAPTAADVSISGRVTTSEGRGIRGARVTVTGNSLSQPITVSTGVNGRYTVPGLTAGETYVVTVGARRFFFTQPSRVITLQDSVTDADFTGSGGTSREQ